MSTHLFDLNTRTYHSRISALFRQIRKRARDQDKTRGTHIYTSIYSVVPQTRDNVKTVDMNCHDSLFFEEMRTVTVHENSHYIERVWVVKNTVTRLELYLPRSRIMVRGSCVKGTSFVGVNSSESEDGIMKDVKERLTCPHLGTLSTLGYEPCNNLPPVTKRKQ